MNTVGKVTMKLEGIDSLIALLRQLPTNVAGKLVKPAMQEAGNLLKAQVRMRAYQQLQAAEGRGYKRKKKGPHLYATAATRAKMYRKGETTFVAVGFDYKAGGSHAHLVEFGHRIVHGGTLNGGITAAGARLLRSHGFVKGDYAGPPVLHGRGKGKPRKLRGAWKDTATGKVREGSFFGKFFGGTRIRGGGKVGGMTKAYPILGPAFSQMQRPMMIAIENELKKIEGEAVRLAGNVGQKKHWWN